jgi:CMP/dCMP kinase
MAGWGKIRQAVGMKIAIDGPAASGKGTLARKIAAHYNLGYLDTGAMYRAVARDVIRAGHRLEDVGAATRAARDLDAASLGDPAIREAAAGEAASVVAKIPEVRAALLQFQRAFAAQGRGAVLDGRDIGTVVLPDADVKIFVVADVAVRARRRFKELAASGEAVTYDGVLAIVIARDERDTDRAVSPMKPADDAFLLDTTHMDVDAAFLAAVALIATKLGG